MKTLCVTNIVLIGTLILLYFQHQDEPDESLPPKNVPRVRAGRRMRVYKNAFKCIVEATKKKWTKK